MRSLLLVRVDDAAAIEAALRSASDALVLCLDGFGPDAFARAKAREAAVALLRSMPADTQHPLLYVDLREVDGPSFDDDLAVVMAGAPDGILLGNARGGADVQHLGAKLAVWEAEHGLADGETGIIAEVGHARGLMELASYEGASARLFGLSWHAARLAEDLGSDPKAWPDPQFGPFQTTRHLTLFAARAAAVAAIDTASPTTTDAAFLAECRAARQQGFNAKFAVTSAQAEVVNAVFGHVEG